MATAVISGRNESSWGKSLGAFMGKKKLAYSNPNPNLIPNPKQSKPKKKQFHAANGRYTDDSPAVTVAQSVPDDAYSFNQTTSIDTSTHKGEVFNHGGYVNLNVSAYSKCEVNELRKKLEADLEQVRNLNYRIESGQFPPRSNHGKTKTKIGHKRPFPAGIPVEEIYVDHEISLLNRNDDDRVALMKMCRPILTKLMKHKHSWVFNKPVDAVALGLHDYHQIVKRPMDLGTVKSNFGKNLYSSPIEFASDVRLTFNNAMLYNPKTDEVHLMADQLLSYFEGLFRSIQDKLQINFRKEELDELQGSSWNEIPTPERPKKPKTNLMGSIQKKSEPLPEPVQNQNQSSASNPSNSNQPSAQSPVPTPSPMRAQPVKPTSPVKGAPTGKQPKPRAKDPNKRDMTMEEKQRLGVGLQNLPQEKMPQLVQIIRKRNEHLAEENDEIELDIEALDTETLWELDRFVTNWKKLVSKTKRQALMGNFSAAPMATTTDTDEGHVSDRNDGGPKKIKKGDGEEDVDIGDEMPESSFPPVEIEPVEIEMDDGGLEGDNGGDGRIENGNGNASSSSSSSGSSSSDSSSSDSDSGSSSGSDSDADEAQS